MFLNCLITTYISYVFVSVLAIQHGFDYIKDNTIEFLLKAIAKSPPQTVFLHLPIGAVLGM